MGRRGVIRGVHTPRCVETLFNATVRVWAGRVFEQVPRVRPVHPVPVVVIRAAFTGTEHLEIGETSRSRKVEKSRESNA